MPCEASELVHFRHRIEEEGIELILKESIRVNGKDGEEKPGNDRYNSAREEYHISNGQQTVSHNY